MAHFAKLDSDNIVCSVHVVSNFVIEDENGDEQEELGIKFLNNLHKYSPNTIWKQTSYNGTIRKNYAGPGYTYDETRDAFIPPKRPGQEDYVLDEDTCQWIEGE